MEEPELNVPENGSEQPGGLVQQVSGDQVHFESGLAFRVSAEKDVTMGQSVALGVAAGQDMTLSDSPVFGAAVGRDMKASDSAVIAAAVGHDLEMAESGAVALKVGGSVNMTDSGVAVAQANQIIAQGSSFGVVLARQVDLGEGSRVVLNTPQAAALGAAAGAVFALLSWILRKK